MARIDTSRLSEGGNAALKKTPTPSTLSSFKKAEGTTPVVTTPAFEPAKPAATSAIDGRATLAKLTGGQELTDAEKSYLGLPVTPATKTEKDPAPRTEVSRVDNGDGTFTVTYSDNTTEVTGTKRVAGGNEPAPVTLVSTELDDYGNTIGFYSDGTSKQLLASGNKYRSTVDEDAYSLLKQTLEDYNLGELTSVIQGYMDEGLGANQATLELRKNPIYVKRFKGNENRKDAGLNVLSEAEYLDLENSYTQTLKSYGLANQLGTDAATRRAAMADIIGNDISAVEFTDRIKTVVDRVKNADKSIKETMASFYGIKEDDLVAYFINPKDNLPKLKEKVTAAEIGAAAAGQNLLSSKTTAEDLAKFGITQEQAQQGYATIGEVMPTATKLGEIYGNKYDQATAEAEVFKGTASAKRKRQQLADQEVASFSGSSGRLRTGQQQGNTGKF